MKRETHAAGLAATSAWVLAAALLAATGHTTAAWVVTGIGIWAALFLLVHALVHAGVRDDQPAFVIDEPLDRHAVPWPLTPPEQAKRRAQETGQ